MKTLVDLAFEWSQELAVVYMPEFQQWRAHFVYAYEEGTARRRFGFGTSPEAALKMYAQEIRGRKLDFANNPLKEPKQVPEVICS